MSKAFNKFLKGDPGFKGYSHASNFYDLGGGVPKLPKLGFTYFVAFNLAPEVNEQLPAHSRQDLGFLAKKVDLPKFKITTQTVNQYNRKTNVQTKLSYENMSIEFHDDTSEITNSLWRLYYDHYFADGRQGKEFGQSFTGDTKYNSTNYEYGYSKKVSTSPFFSSIDIYVLNGGKFSQYSISNPMISSWDHDTVDQSGGTKILQNKMQLMYDSVVYSSGYIKGSDDDKVGETLEAVWYDKTVNLPDGYEDPSRQYIEPITPKYETPSPPGLTGSQLDKLATRVPVYGPPRPIGAGTFGLSSIRPPKPFSIDVWYGYGGLHGRAVINAGPVRLVLKK